MTSYEFLLWQKEYALRADEREKAQKRARGKSKQRGGEGSWRVS